MAAPLEAGEQKSGAADNMETSGCRTQFAMRFRSGWSFPSITIADIVLDSRI
jgi:hypothetical protein